MSIFVMGLTGLVMGRSRGQQDLLSELITQIGL